MNSNLFFDFTVDKENNTINIRRDFAANVELVWKAWTTPELLDQWWAPKPYKARTKTMDFREGGFWLYAMVSPENEHHWCRADYRVIDHQKSFSLLDAFCDENGNVSPDFPRSFWTNVFNGQADASTVNISIKYDSLDDLEKMIELGFKDGFTMGLGNLDELLVALSSQKS